MTPLEKIFNALKNSEIYNKLGLGGIRIIKKRTREGMDVNGERFKPYSLQYKKKRERAGKQTDIVQLMFDDYFGMMNKIDHVVGRDLETVSLIIDSEEKAQIAKYHNELGAGKSKVIRQFWAFSPEEEKQLQQLAQKEVDNILSKL